MADNIANEDLGQTPNQIFDTTGDKAASAPELIKNQLQLIHETKQLLSKIDGSQSCNWINIEWTPDRVWSTLTKHQASELTIDFYKGVIKETSAAATKLLNTNYPDAELIKKPDNILKLVVNDLEETAKRIRYQIVAAVKFHEHKRKSVQVLA